MQSARARQLIDDLEAAEAELEAAARAAPDHLLQRRPAADEWSVLEILAHMADSPRFYAAEIRRLIREGGGSFGRPLDDPGRVGPIREHAGDSLDQAIARNRAGVAEATALIATLTDADLAIHATHPRVGAFDVAGLVARFIVNHRRDHARQIREATAALRSAEC
jgi:hypothetical protein